VGFLKSAALRALPSASDPGGQCRMVHALEQNDPAAIVDEGDDAAPVIALRFGLGRCHHLPCRFQAQRLLPQELGLSGLPH